MKKMTQTLVAALCLFSGSAFAQEAVVKKPEPAAETSQALSEQDKYRYEMLGLMKSAGFEGEQIEAYQELSRKNSQEIASVGNNAKMKQSEKDTQIKKIQTRQDEELKKIFGAEHYEKYREMLKQVYGSQE
jgi:hypothetical protein